MPFKATGPYHPFSSLSPWIVQPCLVALLAAGLAMPPTVAQAQPSSLTVSVTGTVSDPSGGVLPGVLIEVISDGRLVFTATTGPDGRYRVPLEGGRRQEIRASLDGFATRAVELTPAGPTTQNFQLAIGAFSDRVVATASRTPRSRATVTDSVSVLTAEDLIETGSHSIADALVQIPGLALSATGREGGLTSLFTRGGESDYNHVLIDGVRVNANGGQFDFGRISAAEVDRIEVVRGAQSSLYGSDAIGSVVQIFTRRGSAGSRPELAGSFEGGSFRTFRGDVRVLGGARDRVDYQLGVSYRGTDGAFSDRLVEDDQYDQTAVDGGAGVLLDADTTLRAGVRYNRAQGRAVGPLDFGPGDRGTRYDTEDISGHLTLDQQLTPAISHTATVTYYRHDRFEEDTVADAPFNLYTVLEGEPGALFPNGPSLVRLVDETTYSALRATPGLLGPGQFLASTPFGAFFGDFPFEADTQLRRPGFDYQADIDWLSASWLSDDRLSLGYEFEQDRDPLTAGHQITNHAVFAQQEITLRDRWFVTAGGRVDDNSRYGTEVSPKVSAGGFPVPFRPGLVSSVKLFTNVGRGIKNPTFGELFDGDFSDGNPDLEPERARTFDVGVEVSLADQRALGRAAYFDNRYENQVAFLSSGFGLDGIADFINVAGSEARGVEVEATLQRPFLGMTASGSYAYVDSAVVATVSSNEEFQPGQPLLRRPKHSGAIRVNYTRGATSVHLDVRAVGERHDAAFAGLYTPDFREVDITVNPAYTVVSLGGQVRLQDDLTMYIRLENLTDERYSTALGYPGMPRAVVVGGRFNVRNLVR